MSNLAATNVLKKGVIDRRERKTEPTLQESFEDIRVLRTKLQLEDIECSAELKCIEEKLVQSEVFVDRRRQIIIFGHFYRTVLLYRS